MNWTATISANPGPCKRCSKPTPATPLNARTWGISLIIYGKKTNLERNGKQTAYGCWLMDRKIGFGVNGTSPQIAGEGPITPPWRASQRIVHQKCMLWQRAANADAALFIHRNKHSSTDSWGAFGKYIMCDLDFLRSPLCWNRFRPSRTNFLVLRKVVYITLILRLHLIKISCISSDRYGIL